MLARLKRLEEYYQANGMRRTCEGVLVCHEHNHPHILMLQIANAFFKLYVNGSNTLKRMLNDAGLETILRTTLRRSKASRPG